MLQIQTTDKVSSLILPLNTGKSRCNAVNISWLQALNGALWGVLMRILIQKNDCVITAPHCILQNIITQIHTLPLITYSWNYLEQDHRKLDPETNELRHCGRNKMAAAISQIFSNTFRWLNLYVMIPNSLKFANTSPIDNKSVLFQVMAWGFTYSLMLWCIYH